MNLPTRIHDLSVSRLQNRAFGKDQLVCGFVDGCNRANAHAVLFDDAKCSVDWRRSSSKISAVQLEFSCTIKSLKEAVADHTWLQSTIAT